MFERIARVDRPLVLLNLVLLLSVAVIPFTTGLLAGYLRGAGEHVAAEVYAATGIEPVTSCLQKRPLSGPTQR